MGKKNAVHFRFTPVKGKSHQSRERAPAKVVPRAGVHPRAGSGEGAELHPRCEACPVSFGEPGHAHRRCEGVHLPWDFVCRGQQRICLLSGHAGHLTASPARQALQSSASLEMTDAGAGPTLGTVPGRYQDRGLASSWEEDFDTRG